MNRESNLGRQGHIVKTHFKHLACGALLLSLGAGCNIIPCWLDCPPSGGETGGETGGGVTGFRGVNVMNCTVYYPEQGKFGKAYTVWSSLDGVVWEKAEPNQLNPPDKNNQDTCSSAYIAFDVPGTWTVRVIQADFGDPYSPPTNCDSSTGEATGCLSSEYEDRKYVQDPAQGDALFEL